MMLTDALDRFVIQLEADGRSPNTIAQYRRHVTSLDAWLGAPDVGTVTHEDVARFLSSPQTRASRGPITLNALRTSLRMFFRYAHESGVISQNPARLVRRALCAPPPPRALSDDERDRMLAAASMHPRDHALFHLLATTGIRVGSCVALDVDDVDLDRSEMRLRKTKGDRPDIVFLTTAARDHLRGYIGDRKSGALFSSRQGERISTRHVQRRLGHWLAVAGIKAAASPHWLRHGFAMSVYKRSGDIAVTQAALRHRSIASTLVYARADEARIRRAIEA